MRRIQIKIWPEIDQHYPAIISLERTERNKQNPLDIDLTYTHKVSSSSLAILLINLIKSTSELPNRSWDILPPKNELIDSEIRNLNFYGILLKTIPNQNLFWSLDLNSEMFSSPIVEKQDNNWMTKKYPIYELAFSHSQKDRRDVVDKFKKYLIKELYFLQEEFDFDLSIFIQVLVEMAKNSADHTNANAYFGLDIVNQPSKVILKFSFGDLGSGLNQAIRKFIKYDEGFTEKEKHLALTDSYHWALQVGTTTKPKSKLNKGIGMSTIFNLSKQLDFNLSVYDAESRGILSFANNITHSELRKIFYATGHKVGFYYYGETEIEHI